MTVAQYADKFARLRVATPKGRNSPHKICMLLATLDLARGGALPDNRIRFAPPLLERYAEYFDAVGGPGDHRNPYFPFYYLKGDLRGGAPSFWHHKILPGREDAYQALRAARSASDITANIDYAFLDQDLFELLASATNIDALASALSRTWFNRGLEELGTVLERTRPITQYERTIRQRAGLQIRSPTPPEYVRDPAFRRVVTQIYDYRCAATGVRLLLPDGKALVQAAHIHPFSEAQDDDPRNGVALTPDMHWAMDQNLIAPGPDLKWHVSRFLDRRIPDFDMLVRLDGQPLLTPADNSMTPKREALTWRFERLRQGY